MATIICLSFWHHLLIIGSSVISLNGIVPLDFQNGCIDLAASILVMHDAFFVAFLTAYLPWECATALYHGTQPYLTVTTSFQILLHVIFLAKPHHFSAAKVVCGVHFVYGLQGLLRIGQWFYENLPFSFLTLFNSCHCQQKEYLQKMPWRTLPSALLWLHL